MPQGPEWVVAVRGAHESSQQHWALELHQFVNLEDFVARLKEFMRANNV
jgi:hypothetical protein